ncbi:MAG: response regulator [Alteromonadaceae bacterium]|nr:response regulator [Alteromonadaceae bacterium]
MITVLDFQLIDELPTLSPSVRLFKGHSDNGDTLLIKELHDYDEQRLKQFRSEIDKQKHLNINCVKPVDLFFEHQLSYFAVIRCDHNFLLFEQYVDSLKRDIEAQMGACLALSEFFAEFHDAEHLLGNVNLSGIFFDKTESEFFTVTSQHFNQYSQQSLSDGVSDSELAHLYTLSPEGTGRVNRKMDLRSDLYSLGTLFYRILFGRYPFQAEDAMELIHAQIAREADYPDEISRRLPNVLVTIVERLLRKNPNERYQTINGVTADVKACLQQFRAGIANDEIQLVSTDRGIELNFPDFLYGREKELGELTQINDQLLESGNAHVVIVEGGSGVGKSAFIKEFAMPLAKQGAMFAVGKSEQYKRSASHSVLVAAVSDLLEQFLLQEDKQLEQFRDLLLSDMASELTTLAPLLPNLKLILQQSDMGAAAEITATQVNLEQAFFKLFTLLGKLEKQIILFLDDLHWIDSLSTNILSNLFQHQSLPRILFLFSYRDNEVSEDHPVQHVLRIIQGHDIGLDVITLTPLDSGATQQFIEATFWETTFDLYALCDVVHQKTGGNPFFVREFIKSLVNQNFLFQDGENIWSWREQAIYQQRITDNVVDLVTARLARLDLQELYCLKLAACIGNNVPLSILKQLSASYEIDLEKSIDNWIKDGLFVGQFKDETLTSLSFSHDRIQQAAYQMPLKRSNADFHFQISDAYLQSRDDAWLKTNILDIITHIHNSLSVHLEHRDNKALARLYWWAGSAAEANHIFQSAKDYYRHGCSLITTQHWQQDYELCFQLNLGLCNMLYLVQEFKGLDEKLLSLIEQAQTSYDAKCAKKLRILLLIVNNEMVQAFEFGMQVIQSENQDLNVIADVSDYFAIETLYPEKGIQDIANLPIATDKNELIIQEIMNTLHTPAYIVSPDKYLMVMNCSLQALLKGGLSKVASKALMGHAQLLAGAFGRYDEATLFVEVAEQLEEQFHSQQSFAVELELVKHTSIMHWRYPLRESIPALKQNYYLGLENGFVEYAFHSLLFQSFYSLFTGESLDKVNQDLESAISIFTQKQQLYHVGYAKIWHQLLWNLHAKVEDPTILTGPSFQETDDVSVLLETNNVTTLLCYYIAKMVLCYHFDRIDTATEFAEKAEALLEVAPGLYHVTEFYCFKTLIYLKRLQDTDKSSPQWQEYFDVVAGLQSRILTWISDGSANHEHQAALIAAELAAIDDNPSAWKFYSKAITLANKHQFTQYSALAHELYGNYWRKQGEYENSVAQHELAYKKYNEWQAFNLSERLLEKHSDLKRKVDKEVAVVPAGTENSLDLASILKAAETLTGAVDFEAFIERMMAIIVENAGAQRGCILFYQNDEITLETCYPTPIPREEIPSTLLNYVSRTMQPYIVDDSAKESKLNIGLKSIGKLPQSMLFIPIVVSGDLRGVLYLEHKDLTGFFKDDRVDVLQLLANQTAILFDNARLYNQVLASNKNLERKVEQRTEELASAKLRAEEATAAKSNFLANMSHEIRTPMNAVIGLSRLALRKQKHPEHRDYLEKILSSSEALLTLINDILDFSKIEAQKLTLEHTQFSLESSLRRVINLHSHKMHEKHLEFVLSVESDVPDALMGDPLRLEQIMINLVSNAIKFTEKGYVQVTIRPEKVAGDKITLYFSIKDSGIGMSEEQAGRLFQSFSQADESVTRKYGGTGLGLAICKQLCQMMSGEIWVTSELEKGSDFQFRVELGRAESGEQPVSLAHPGGMRALVVDDMAIARKVLCDYLVGLGIQTDTATNGQEALSAVMSADQQNRSYDMVLMDWKMPEMDGLTASKLIRDQVSGKTPHILMVSAYDREEVQQSQPTSMIDDFIEKPVSASTLIDKINGILGNNKTVDIDTLLGDKIPDLVGYRLLLVEDNKINQQVAMEFLTDTGAAIDVANNGLEAIEAVTNVEFDLIFMDIQMPKMDGLTATRKIREFNTAVPIVAMTAHAMEGDREKSLAVGMNDHVTKPIEPDALYRMLSATLGESKQKIARKVELPSVQHDIPIDNTNETQRIRQLGILDVDSAIERFQGKTQLYEELARDFVKDYSVIAKQLKPLAESGDNELLHRKIHSLKSNTAYIGAMELSRNVAVLEQMILDAVDFELELHVVVEELTELLEKLRTVYPNVEAEEEDKPEQALDCHGLLNLIQPMLKASDFNVEIEIAKLVSTCADEAQRERAEHLLQLVDDMEFEEAFDLVSEWLTEF